jgi:hypothetical protein
MHDRLQRSINESWTKRKGMNFENKYLADRGSGNCQPPWTPVFLGNLSALPLLFMRFVHDTLVAALVSWQGASSLWTRRFMRELSRHIAFKLAFKPQKLAEVVDAPTS